MARMAPPRRIHAVVLAVSLALATGACGGATPEAAAPGAAVAAEAPKPKPRNAQDIARAVIGGRVDVLVFADRVRAHPVGPKLAALDAWRPVLEGTGIDPQKDLERAFVTAPSARA